MIRRRELVTLLGGAVATWPLTAGAQQGERVRRIGVLYDLGENDPEEQRAHAVFVHELQQLNWQDGRNLVIDVRYSAGDAGRMRVCSKELVDLKPDLIFARSTPVVAALLRETRAIPIVFVGVTDPVFSGFVASLARPAGSVTGFAVAESSIGGKWVELLKEIAPDVTRAAIVFNPQMAVGGGSYYMQAIEEASRSLAILPIGAPVLNVDDIEGAMADSARERGGGLVVLPDAFTVLHTERIIALAARHRLPAVYGWPSLVKEGGLISYSVDIVDHYRKAASYVDRILKGEKPANLPVQTPTKFELAVNVKTAKALGLIVPPSMQQLADEVIE